jgi:low temperature requirement protein LtrA
MPALAVIDRHDPPSPIVAPHVPPATAPGSSGRIPITLHRLCAGRITPPRLRTANGHHRDERRASWLELFFDLVFAGAVGQLAGALQDHPTIGELSCFAILFAPIWWLWVQLTFYADRHESDDGAHRAAFLVAMLFGVGLAASARHALQGHPTSFVIAFACVRGLQLVLYARARHHLPVTRALYSWYLIFFGAGGVLWLSSLAATGPVRYAIWGAALLADAGGALAMLAPRRRLPVNMSHLADRFQIFVLIVLGESVARLISAAAMRPWSLSLAVVLVAALATLASLWWAWLRSADGRALGHPKSVARFTAANLPIVAGVAAASVGLHLAILAAHSGGTIGIGPRAALYGGVSIALLASALLPSATLTRRRRVWRLMTALAAMGLIFMGAIVVPVYLVPALAVILVVDLIGEARLCALPGDGRGPAPAALGSREQAGHVAGGGGDLTEPDADVDQQGLRDGAAAGAQLPVSVPAPRPQPARAADRVAGVATRAERSNLTPAGTLARTGMSEHAVVPLPS